MYYNQYRKPGEMSNTRLIRGRKLGEPGSFNNEEFLSEEDDETKLLEEKYCELQSKEQQLLRETRDFNEIYKMRTEALDNLIQDTINLKDDPEFKEMILQHEVKKKILEQKEKEIQELTDELQIAKTNWSEQQEMIKQETFYKYSGEIQQIEENFDKVRESWLKVKKNKKIKKNELERLEHQIEKQQNKLEFLKLETQDGEKRMVALKKDLKEKKGKLRDQKVTHKPIIREDLEDAEEFYCPICGRTLANLVILSCRHIVCMKCHKVTRELNQCLLCGGNCDEIAKINHSNF